ncbi:Lrp/AsnC family transcriptional regulator [Halegenticoccus soli]|uniref:Lrp/AsnC family transcriptional regulator n=1 Tax=Halegenticoccus soli TaxID=1985678 RepID=UPI000C6EF60C|nr:Lrp/AsnC family transcriptional regulator [Halegenticoccus soli]
MDARDLAILKAVYGLGTPSPKHIESETGIPKSTIHYRLNKLREAGVLKNDLYELDAAAIGLDVTVITEVLAEFAEGYHESVGSRLGEIDGVSDVYFTMGDTDFIVVAHLPNGAFVQRLIEEYEAIDGVERTSSKFVIATIKEEQNPIHAYHFDTLLELDLQSNTE